MLTIDINCDMGESYGRFKVGQDKDVFPYITSCNIACGWHGGDPATMERTIKLALEYGVRIGAHPSYPDLQGFGRRYIQMSMEDLTAGIRYQISALRGLVESLGGVLSYIKPHGALYNRIASNRTEAQTVYRAIKALDPGLSVMGLAGSNAEMIAKELGMTFIAEAFADRRYTPDGQLQSRSIAGAVIRSPEDAAAQVLSIIRDRQVITSDMTALPITAHSICIHGDNPAAIPILKEVDHTLDKFSIIKIRHDQV